MEPLPTLQQLASLLLMPLQSLGSALLKQQQEEAPHHLRELWLPQFIGTEDGVRETWAKWTEEMTPAGAGQGVLFTLSFHGF